MDRVSLLLILGILIAAFCAGFLYGTERTDDAWRAAQPPTIYDGTGQPP